MSDDDGGASGASGRLHAVEQKIDALLRASARIEARLERQAEPLELMRRHVHHVEAAAARMPLTRRILFGAECDDGGGGGGVRCLPAPEARSESREA